MNQIWKRNFTQTSVSNVVDREPGNSAISTIEQEIVFTCYKNLQNKIVVFGQVPRYKFRRRKET